jgi:acetylornithine deacetylase/succinyl-diaminopimelate desuccinylase-like protein
MRRLTIAVVLMLSAVGGTGAAVQTRPPLHPSIAGVADDAAVEAALAHVKASEPQTIETQIRLTEIPAPPFNERARAEEMRRLFAAAGLQNARLDKAGNVLAERRGAALRPHVVVAAHLDSVFPEGTQVQVRREGAVLRAPGIGDDSRGLALLVAIARALAASNVQTPGTITFVADVGEEGLGDLRGVKALFDDTLKGVVDRFVTIDGTGMSIAHTFVGSRRYRVTFSGPGGHSFTDFGVPNPIGALGRAVAGLSDVQLAAGGDTTFNVGRVGGGTSINAIPAEAWMEVDLRSVDRAALAALDARFQKTVDAALAAEHAHWPAGGRLKVTKTLVGDRPAGETPADSLVVQAAFAATRAVDAIPVTSVGSSDANYPTSLGIPAIHIGGGGRGGDAHAPSEWFDTTESWRGTQRALLLIVALARK